MLMWTEGEGACWQAQTYVLVLSSTRGFAARVGVVAVNVTY
jgi:hypothetical protein